MRRAAARAGRGHRSPGRRRHHAPEPAPPPAAARPDAHGLPGPVLVAEPADDGRADRGRAAATPSRPAPAGGTGRGRGTAGAGRALRPLPGPLPARTVRRATPTRRFRPLDRAAPATARRRRTDLRTGRFGAGIDPQPAPRATGRPRFFLPVHRTRPEHGRVPVRPGGRDVPRPHRRDRQPTADLHRAQAPLHAVAARRRRNPRSPGPASPRTDRAHR